MTKKKTIFFTIMIFLLIAILIILGFFFVGKPKQAENITWGVNFSQKHAENLGLNWKDVYSAYLKDLKVKNVKVAIYWDLIELKKGEYNFSDLDWQVQEAERNDAKLILVIGRKVPRWPECFEPNWLKSETQDVKNGALLKYIEKIVERYKGSKAISAWQVENEPLFKFGECPAFDEKLFKQEISLVKSLDKDRKVIVTDSGEFSLWTKAAGFGDELGVTMYRKVWFSTPTFAKIGFNGFYMSYYFPPVFYQRKAELIRFLFNKEVSCLELQAEPWGPKLLYDLPLVEQEKTMDPKKFEENIDFAKKTGLNEFYLWGGEWWYWMKEKSGKPEVWEEARKIFND